MPTETVSPNSLSTLPRPFLVIGKKSKKQEFAIPVKFEYSGLFWSITTEKHGIIDVDSNVGLNVHSK